jgi:hypothetical protein
VRHPERPERDGMPQRQKPNRKRCDSEDGEESRERVVGWLRMGSGDHPSMNCSGALT